MDDIRELANRVKVAGERLERSRQECDAFDFDEKKKWPAAEPRPCSLCGREFVAPAGPNSSRQIHCVRACAIRAADLRRSGRPPKDPGYLVSSQEDGELGRAIQAAIYAVDVAIRIAGQKRRGNLAVRSGLVAMRAWLRVLRGGARKVERARRAARGVRRA